jgi:hypothetical protein
MSGDGQPPMALVAIQLFTGAGLGGMIATRSWEVSVAEAAGLSRALENAHGPAHESVAPARAAYDAAQQAKEAGAVFYHPGD